MYHGLLFDPDGTVVEIPGQDKIPPQARVRAYPAVERASWIWVWMGASDLADPALVPSAFGLVRQGREMRSGRLDYRAHYELINDNLCDLSHVDFLHEKTLGAATGEIGVAFDDMWTADASPVSLRREEVAKAHERMIMPPFFATGQTGTLDAPEREPSGVVPGRHANAGLFHLIGEGMENAHDQDLIRAAVQAGVHGGRNLMAAVAHARMREHHHTARGQKRGEVPLARSLQSLRGPRPAELLVLGAVDGVDVIAQAAAIEFHDASSSHQVSRFTVPRP